jgi:hypothetical protein
MLMPLPAAPPDAADDASLSAALPERCQSQSFIAKGRRGRPEGILKS